MATKPTERIPDWASTGTVADPGTSKEAAGWLTSERMPAGWLNWIWNTFGKWVGYLDEQVDANLFSTGDNAGQILLLQPSRIYGLGRVESGPTPAILYNRAGLASVSTNGTALVVTLGVTYASTDQMVISCTSDQANINVAAAATATNEVTIAAYSLTAGGFVDMDTLTYEFNLWVAGSLT